jgi:cytochrome c2
MITFPHELQQPKKTKVGPTFHSLTKRSAARRVNLRYSLAQKDYLRVETQSLAEKGMNESCEKRSLVNGT